MSVEKAAGQEGHVLSKMGASIEMPRYRSHKLVWALKIEAIHRDADIALRHGRGSDGSAMLIPENRNYGPIHVDLGFMAKHQPVEGGFYVVYEDGYASFSPAKAFEEGNLPYRPLTACVGATAIATIVHEANRAYCRTLGDDSQVPWDVAPDWQRGSALQGVVGILNGSITKPEESHESWLAEKARTGWKFGPVKDAEKKEHPCFVPYAELPPDQRAKDALFFAIVRALA